MARGAAQQENLLNTQAGTSFGNAQKAYGSAYGGYQDILNNPGYSAADKAAITSATLDPISSTYGSATQDLYNRAARTRNDAALTAGADQLARSKAEGLSNASGQLAQTFANTAMSERDRALAGMAGLYSPSLSSSSSLYGQGTQAMMARPSVLQDVGQVIGDVATLGGAGIGAYTSLFPGSGGGGGGGGIEYARGGKVRGKKPIIVGEEGPEVFVPDKGGRIIPNPYTRRAA